MKSDCYNFSLVLSQPGLGPAMAELKSFFSAVVRLVVCVVCIALFTVRCIVCHKVHFIIVISFLTANCTFLCCHNGTLTHVNCHCMLSEKNVSMFSIRYITLLLFQPGLGPASAELLGVVRYECCNVFMTVVKYWWCLTVVISLVDCCNLST